MNYNYTFKSIVIGDSGVGKSSLLLQFTDKRFSAVSDLTIGVEFGAKVLNISNKKIKLHVWDTAGQEKFRSITQSYYKDSAICLLVYDITNMSSFESIIRWLTEVRESSNNSVVILVGNKSDLESKRQITKEMGQDLATKYNMLFIETSAKNSQNVDLAFEFATAKTLKLIEMNMIDPSNNSGGIKLGTITNINDSQNNASCCGI